LPEADRAAADTPTGFALTAATGRAIARTALAEFQERPAGTPPGPLADRDQPEGTAPPR
jgi:hypothetical protein